MPYGAGAGGGGFSGGGGYGGYHGGYHGGRRGGRCSPCQALIWLCIIVFGSIFGIIFGTSYGVPADSSLYTLYAPNETRFHTYSTIGCESFTASFDGSETTFNAEASLSILSGPPSLTGSDSFSFEESPSFGNGINYHYWSFYLNPGSKFAMSACRMSSLSNVRFYFIRGRNRFREWENNPRDNRAIDALPVSAICSTNTFTQYAYTVTEENSYYLVYYLSSGERTSFTVKMDFVRTKYVADPNTVISNCTLNYPDSTGRTSCTLDVLYSEYNVALIEMVTFDNSNDIWSTQASYNLRCNARAWVFVVIAIATIVFILSVAACTTFGCYYLWKLNKKTLTATTTTTVISSSNPVTVPLTSGPAAGQLSSEAPPPYDPAYAGTSSAQPKFY